MQSNETGAKMQFREGGEGCKKKSVKIWPGGSNEHLAWPTKAILSKTGQKKAGTSQPLGTASVHTHGRTRSEQKLQFPGLTTQLCGGQKKEKVQKRS